ncbi:MULTISPECIES: isoprenylcysteine carboxyl methyltransferase family protein [unclassified Rhizobium]|uniref:isoprenylcysteine carboxyl methyltransferase family protein n=1 Tax=unclassified Rhizobium TaxID=2613769 RepID=UPI0007E9B96C|nr:MULTISPECIES: isoprenylcysteine carboxylmethyltransferase family protein [unclassified Rhizobium]ANM09276.1 isoprenylcysteine carboxyl methyltransferase protein [Rhizobium sp. N324]OYD02844.1 isoprenylcysteine carboxyl methyltransferase protein [Rhizobium sp. N4311]
MMWPSIALLTFVTLQRLGELALARRNTAALIAKGAREVAPEHYPAMVALHAGWIIGLWLLAPGRPVEPYWFAVFIGLQALRLWVLATLKDRWTTRIIILPGAPLVTSGPYRFLRHPNYAIVVGEIAALPLAFGLPFYAIGFSLLNACVLYVRMRAENAALKSAMIVK